MCGGIVSPTSREEMDNSGFGGLKIKNFNRYKGVIGALFVIIIIGVFSFNIYAQPNAVSVKVDGSVIGIAKGQQQVEEIVEALHKEKEVDGLSLSCISTIEFEPIKAKKDEIMEEDQAASVLEETLVFHYGAFGIFVDGQEKVILEDMKLAEKVVQDVKESYLPANSDSDEINILELKAAEKITIEPVEVDKEDIVSYEDALEALKFGEEEVTYYQVESGDSLWTIAEKNGMRVSELEEANPEINGTLLNIGQDVRLIKPEPAFNVQVKYEQVAEQAISSPVKYVNTDSLFRGQQKVQEAGSSGKKEVTYFIEVENGKILEKKIVDEVVIEEPKTKVVSVGTKVMTASRGGGGSGPLAWPIRGSITSPYGYRSGGFHTGIDISGKTGDPIYSAEAGSVIFSGWRGGYGNLVIVDHGDGVTTYYAHASQRLVSSGAQVKRGDLVAKVGSTGNSTGPHLHFEVRINGQPDNPTKYVRN
ncbi:MAG: hypothetical protein APF76_00640 [Desulfitibacter sp. BRH_c19]|nr:MAG: hypothetical protein APF76_00640 [Desulfitibacter sp. BRH_c19]